MSAPSRSTTQEFLKSLFLNSRLFQGKAKGLPAGGRKSEGKGVTVRKSDFREGGVYSLPDGRELIASESGLRFKLYDPLAWKYQGPALYETDGLGLLTSVGRPTPWRVDDLQDKGRTALRRSSLR